VDQPAAAFTETFYTPGAGSGVTLTPAGSVNDGNGGNNYAVTFVTDTTGQITPALPTVVVADAGGVANGSPYAATATVAGVVAGVDATPATSLEDFSPTFTYYAGDVAGGTVLAGPPTSAGHYTVVASFPGSPDYAAADSSAVNFTIDTPTFFDPAGITAATVNAGQTYTLPPVAFEDADPLKEQRCQEPFSDRSQAEDGNNGS